MIFREEFFGGISDGISVLIPIESMNVLLMETLEVLLIKIPRRNPDGFTRNTPAVIPRRTSDVIPIETPNGTRIPGGVPDVIPRKTSDVILGGIPGETLERIPEGISLLNLHWNSL